MKLASRSMGPRGLIPSVARLPLTLVLLLLGPLVPFVCPSDFQNGTAQTLGVSFAVAGWILGGGLSIAFVFVAMILGSKLESGSEVPTFALLAIGIGISVGIGWWPVWMLVFCALFILLAITFGLNRPAGG